MYPPRPKVTVTHKPSGISAYCDQCRTNRENHDKAMRLLKSRLWAAQQFEIPKSDICVELFEPAAPDMGGGVMRCPKCRGNNFDLCTQYIQTGRAQVRNGKWDGKEGCDSGDQGGSVGFYAECINCGHEWRPRKIKSLPQFERVHGHDMGGE